LCVNSLNMSAAHELPGAAQRSAAIALPAAISLSYS
jgi:hypothetical protein